MPRSRVAPSTIRGGTQTACFAAQRRDIRGAIAEFGQYRVSVLTRLRRGGADGPRRAAQFDRLANDLDIAQYFVIDFTGDAEMFHLRIVKHFVHLINRTTGHAFRVQFLDPFGRGPLPCDHLDRLIQNVTIFEPDRPVAHLGSLARCGTPQCAAASLIDVVAGGGDVDVTVRRREHAGWYACWMIVARLARHFMRDRPARRLKVEHGDLRAKQ